VSTPALTHPVHPAPARPPLNGAAAQFEEDGSAKPPAPPPPPAPPRPRPMWNGLSKMIAGDKCHDL
jgi:hypothetical protein